MTAPSLPWRCWIPALGWRPDADELHKATLIEAPTAREAAIAYALDGAGDGVVAVVPAHQQGQGRWRWQSEWLVRLDEPPHAERWPSPVEEPR